MGVPHDLTLGVHPSSTRRPTPQIKPPLSPSHIFIYRAGVDLAPPFSAVHCIERIFGSGISADKDNRQDRQKIKGSSHVNPFPWVASKQR
jgi:hypothetical protein